MWTFGNPVCDDEATNIVDGAYHLVHRGDTLVVHVHMIHSLCCCCVVVGRSCV